MQPLDYAHKQIGYTEGANNDNKFGRMLGINHVAWCAIFDTVCFWKSDHKLPPMQAGMPQGFDNVFAGMNWAKDNGLFRPSWEADPNDAIIYGGPSFPEGHTGLIVHSGRRGTTGTTIEGNRGDAVRPEVFTVGADYVLGTIRLSAFLNTKITIHKPADPKAEKHPPQKTPPGQKHTGPVIAPLGAHKQSDVTDLTHELENRKHPLPHGKGSGRGKLRRLAAEITRLFGRKK